jgi:putative ABC transport system permease protein
VLVGLDGAVNPASPIVPPEAVEVAIPLDEGHRGIDHPFVATPELLAHLGIDAAAIDEGTELLTAKDADDLELLDPGTRPDEPAAPLQVQHVDLSPYGSGPQSLITEEAMRDHGWVATREAWLIEADHALTGPEIDAAREIAAASGLSVQSRDDQDSLAAVRTASAAVGGLLALAIVAMAVSLLRGESAQDVRTLTATGADARTRRALTATTAGALATLGVVLSMIGAYAAILAAYSADLGRLAPAPVADLAAITIGLPVVAAAAGWLLAGREPSTATRPVFE